MGPLVGTVDVNQIRKMYRLAAMDASARRLARRITEIGKRVAGQESAFRAQLTVGGLLVELVSHIPNLPVEIWGDRSGLSLARSAYATFEAGVTEPAEAFVRAVLSRTGGSKPHGLRSRRRRSAMRRSEAHGRRSV
jgi:hypothetical protein